MTVKLPQSIFETIAAFPPNRDTLGGTAYLIRSSVGNGLIDCPAWTTETQQFLTDQGGLQWIFLTHRTGKGAVRQVQSFFSCPILIQEQEAYLVPGADLTTFQDEYYLGEDIRLLWTPGHSPGSSCLYTSDHGGILFTGRHILPSADRRPVPLRVAKTFHWPRQIQQTRRILDRFTPETLQYICPGANTGFLRGKRAIANAYEQLSSLDLDTLLTQPPTLQGL